MKAQLLKRESKQSEKDIFANTNKLFSSSCKKLKQKKKLESFQDQ